MKRFGLLFVALGLALFGSRLYAATSTLPGGTDIGVTIGDPANGTNYFVPLGGTVDVNVSGTASVGGGSPAAKTSLIYITDLSDSMNRDAGVDCTGDASNDSRLLCEQEAIATANTAAASPGSSVNQSGIGWFKCCEFFPFGVMDVDLGAPGDQLLVAPAHDGNTNGTRDIEEVANSLVADGPATCFTCGLNAAETILASGSKAVNVVIFMSDGINNDDGFKGDVPSWPGTLPAGTVIHAFALGTDADCSLDPFALGSLNDVAAHTPGGTCRQITDLSTLADEIIRVIPVVGPTLDSLDLEVDGGGPAPIPNTEVTPDLPQPGAASVNYKTLVPSLGEGDHTICLTANGTDSGGSGSVTECIAIHVIAGNPHVIKDTQLRNLWLCEPVATCADPGRGIGGRDFNVNLDRPVGGLDPKCTGFPNFNPPEECDRQTIGSFEFEVRYDAKFVSVTVEAGALFDREDAFCATTPTQNSVQFRCNLKGKPADAPTGPGTLAIVHVRPTADVYSTLIPNQDNGIMTQLINQDCNLSDLQGHPIKIDACDDAAITIRYLEGDAHADCEVDVHDQQQTAFRWGSRVGSLLYNSRFDLEPSTPKKGDGDIDAKDLQMVFGRHGSTCADPHPPQDPVDPKAKLEPATPTPPATDTPTPTNTPTPTDTPTPTPTRPDLQVTFRGSISGPTECTILFRVTNKKAGSLAGASETTVAVDGGEVTGVATPPIAGGAFFDGSATFGSSCPFIPDLSGNLMADATGVIDENDETNNGASFFVAGED